MRVFFKFCFMVFMIFEGFWVLEVLIGVGRLWDLN